MLLAMVQWVGVKAKGDGWKRGGEGGQESEDEGTWLGFAEGSLCAQVSRRCGGKGDSTTTTLRLCT